MALVREPLRRSMSASSAFASSRIYSVSFSDPLGTRPRRMDGGVRFYWLQLIDRDQMVGPVSINTGGIVFKPQFGVSDDEVLKLMAFSPARRLPSVTVERATSSSFDRLAVLNLTPLGTHADAPPPRSYEHSCTVWVFSPKL